ncbi:DUF3231 family protein [Ornithinibacillus xuwenensis]|uniref:DUF3231 family protein n=1 Tax=Ornithinibacillus xuwenensis TaxID=3144668 RepID=A0ABU9XIG2_9BACI
MNVEHHARLSATEITQLWSAYMNDSMAICVLTYMDNIVEDEGVKEIVNYGLKLSESHKEKLKAFFNMEKYPIPVGFHLNEDVDVNAERLYSDTYILNFMRDMAQVGMNNYSMATSLAAREDVYNYFSACFVESNKLHRMAKDLMLSKGVYVRSPNLPIPSKVDFVKKQSFLTGWFGERRPLTGMEISNLYANMQRNVLGVAALISFSQVAKSKEVRQFMQRGKEIAEKHVEVLGSILRENELPAPMSWNAEITENTSFVFSDKLMMFQITALVGIGIGNYGLSLATSHRRDLVAQYTRLTTEIMKYSEDGANIMISNGWLEEPPRESDRQELADG